MKKLFAILMSVLMIACFMPTMAFADGEDTKTYVAQVGETQYETLQAAIEAATAEETTTVELLAKTAAPALSETVCQTKGRITYEIAI